MAKWGEGDPRWIVEERPDATNVNNWHWSERDAGKWSIDRLRALLLDVAFEADGKRVRINEAQKIEGEAIVNNRKAKLIYLYDWKISGKWEGVYLDSSSSSPLVSGTFEINGLSDENDIDEVDVEIVTTDNSDEGYEFKTLVRNVGVVQIRHSLQTYVDELKRDFAKDLIKPVASKMTMTTTAKTTATTTVTTNAALASKLNGVVISHSAANSQPTSTKTSTSSSSILHQIKSNQISAKISTTRISLKDTFDCDPGRLFDIFTDPQLIAAWTKSPVDFQLTRGANFRLFGGNVSGVVEDFNPGVSLKLQWRFQSWVEGHFSQIDVTLENNTSAAAGVKTTFRLEQSGVPSDQEQATIEGWKRNIFSAIKATFGVGELRFS